MRIQCVVGAYICKMVVIQTLIDHEDLAMWLSKTATAPCSCIRSTLVHVINRCLYHFQLLGEVRICFLGLLEKE